MYNEIMTRNVPKAAPGSPTGTLTNHQWVDLRPGNSFLRDFPGGPVVGIFKRNLLLSLKDCTILNS